MTVDLRAFIDVLEREGELARVSAAVDPYLEIAEIADRASKAHGPALLFERPQRAAAEHDAGIGGIVGDGIEDLSRRFGHGIDPLDPRVQYFQRGNDEVGRVEHVEHRAVGPGQPRLHDEGKFRFDPRADETVRRHEAAIGKEHVVEQHAGIRLIDQKRALHRLRGQPDLVAFDDAALGDLDRDPRLLDRIGILDGDGGIILRQLPDLRTGPLRLMKPLGGKTDIVVGQSHAGSAGKS